MNLSNQQANLDDLSGKLFFLRVKGLENQLWPYGLVFIIEVIGVDGGFDCDFP